MNRLQKILAQIIPLYKFSIQRKEWGLLVDTLIKDLPDAFEGLKKQREHSRLLDLSDWELFPDFKFITISYSGTALESFKKKGQNYKLSGQQIFSKKLSDYTNVEFVIRDNLLNGIKLANSNYDLAEFELNKIKSQNIECTKIQFPPSEVDLLYNRLNENIKNKLSPENLFDIDFNQKTYYAFHDLEDGNYLAVDNDLRVYSLVHDAKPTVKKLKQSLEDVLTDIDLKKFDNHKHLIDRYKKSKL